LGDKELEETTKPFSANTFYQALSNIIYIENKRTAMFKLHLPEPVLFLLFGVFVTDVGMLG
jgi:hypothetical protein